MHIAYQEATATGIILKLIYIFLIVYFFFSKIYLYAIDVHIIFEVLANHSILSHILACLKSIE